LNKRGGILRDLRHPIAKWGYYFVIPGLISYGLFTLYPVLRSLLLSISNSRNTGGAWSFVGFGNYAEIFRDKVFWAALKNTFQYVLLTVPLGTAISFVVAIALQGIARHKGFFRALFFIPSIAGVVSIGIIFTWIYEPYSGLLNLLLSKLGIPGMAWLRDKNLVIPSIAAMTIWRTMGYSVVIILAGLMAISKDYYEAARLDGASTFRQHASITLPLIAPTLFFITINNSIQDLQAFSEIMVMTGGGPGFASTTVGYRIYQEAFLYFNFGKASAIAVVLLLIILGITILQLKILSRKTTSY
jgi:multiple sugar transport system permease protein